MSVLFNDEKNIVDKKEDDVVSSDKRRNLGSNKVDSKQMTDLVAHTSGITITPKQEENILNTLEQSYLAILNAIPGEDVTRQGVLKRPRRAAKAMLYFTKGYRDNLTGKHSKHRFSLLPIYTISLLLQRHTFNWSILIY